MARKKNIIAIIQARMGSTRLPGKVLMKISGKPMVWHVVKRLRRSRLITDIVVATSTASADDRLVAFLKKSGIAYCRGNEDDVLDRYYKAALHFESDVIVRITADCPLIDPRVTDSVISAYLRSSRKLDGSSNTIVRTFPRGLDTEVFSFAALERAWKQARQAHQREHVTLYMYEHPQLFKLKSVVSKRDLSVLRWTVDENRDLRFVRKIYARLYASKNNFTMQEILLLLKKEVRFTEINAFVKQKPVARVAV